MTLTAVSEWLNNFFGAFDSSILSFCHSAAEVAGAVLTPLARMITFIGEKGLIFFALALLLICFRRTRRAGVCLFGAVCCGALIGNIILKDLVARPRPLTETALAYSEWWRFVGSPAEDGFSFPSGHVTAAMAGVSALCLSSRRKLMLLGYIYVVLMGFSRCYLMAHYPSDVLAAIIVGGISAIAAYFIAKLIFILLEKYRDNRLCGSVLDFDLANALKRR
ncbi:MAG: phosphatase PAP2 family protein [Eubacteriales bacterium]